jgi:hypothetical protein
MNQWINTAERVPEQCEIVLIFDAPRRVLAQYVGETCPQTPWNLMDGRYLSSEQVLIWAEIAPHPYEFLESLEEVKA